MTRCENLELLVADKSSLNIAREDELHDSDVHCSALEISTELRYIHRSGSSSRSEFAWYATHTRK